MIGSVPGRPTRSVNTLHFEVATTDADGMRCKTCQGEVRFVEGTWTHVTNMKCRTVVVDWPRPLTDDEDEAA